MVRSDVRNGHEMRVALYGGGARRIAKKEVRYEDGEGGVKGSASFPTGVDSVVDISRNDGRKWCSGIGTRRSALLVTSGCRVSLLRVCSDSLVCMLQKPDNGLSIGDGL